MSLVQRAVRGAAWTTATSMVARVFSLVATLLVTHKIAPYEYGQVSAAAVVVLSANMFAGISFANLLIVDQKAGNSEAWHANVIYQVNGLVLLGLAIPLAPYLSHLLNAPDLPRYLPGAALAIALDRLGAVPEKILVRELNFRHLALTRMLGEVFYGMVTLGAAQLGHGGMSLVYGMLARGTVKSSLFIIAVPWRKWCEPHPFDGAITRRLLDYGAPLWVGGISSYIGSNWDNLIVSRYFGPAAMATYSLAFNLAEMPAAQVGEQLCEVLLPSLSRLDPEHQRRALVKSMRVVALVTFPVAIGLMAIANTMVHAFFDDRWLAVAPLLTLLTVRSLTRTIYYPITQFIQAIGRTGYQMVLSLVHTVVLLSTLVLIGGRSVLLTCVGVVSCHAALSVLALVLVRKEGVLLRPIAAGLLRILLSCAAMAAAVLGVRYALAPVAMPAAARLVIEVAVGGFAYAPAAFLLCGDIARDFLSWLRRGMGRTPEPEAT